jgi:hypothetical protein
MNYVVSTKSGYFLHIEVASSQGVITVWRIGKVCKLCVPVDCFFTRMLSELQYKHWK